jgi:Bacterial mobilisation protein (MobC)
MGWKKVIDKRVMRLTVRFTRDEIVKINNWSLATGHSLAYFVRLRTLNFELRPRLTPEEVNIFRKLTGISNNLNQIAKLGHVGDDIRLEVGQTLNIINQAIEKFQ